MLVSTPADGSILVDDVINVCDDQFAIYMVYKEIGA